ncbi:hypothetical protein AVEN_107892-1, partial [Araneus ventricosus]
FEIQLQEDHQYGSLQPDGNFSGMLGALQQKKVDIAGPFVASEQRTLATDFTNCLGFSQLGIITGIISADRNIFLYANLFSWQERYYNKKLQVFSKLGKKNINDLDMHGKPVEETVTEEFISAIDSSINEFSARFSQFKELSETLKFIMYSDVTSFDKLNLSQFDWLEIEEFEMKLIDTSLVQHGIKNLLKQGKSWN